MAAPTQQYPPWLTLETTTLTNTFGTPVLTETTVAYLPLTYYGPSIPLGTNDVWTYGGLTSPALSSATTLGSSSRHSTATPTPLSSSASLSSISSATPTSLPSSSLPPQSTSSSATPPITSSVLTSSSSATSSSSFATSPPSSIAPSSTPFPTSTSSPTSSVSPNSFSSHKPLPNSIIGAILGSIFGSLLLLVALFFFLRSRANRRSQSYPAPIWTGWEVVNRDDPDEFNPDDPRPPGEGSPRGSGDEADPFLQRSSGVESVRLVASSAVAAGGAGSTLAAEHVGGGEQSSHSGSGSAERPGTPRAVGMETSSSWSSLFYNPNEQSNPQNTPLQGDSPTRFIGGPILSRELLMRINDEPVTSPTSPIYSPAAPDHESHNSSSRSRHKDVKPSGNDFEFSPLLPPPVLNTDSNGARRPLSTATHQSQAQSQHTRAGSPYPETDPDELATFLTARRVRLDDTQPKAAPLSGFGTLGGLAGLAKLKRLSWFRRTNESSNGVPSSSTADAHAHARAAMPPSSFLGPRSREFGHISNMGERPISGVSARSGRSGVSTIYHDAHSTASSADRALGPSPLPPAAGILVHGPSHLQTSVSAYASPKPPAYEERESHSQQSDELGRVELPPETGDPLDTPAPAAISPFSTASSRATALEFPPGLNQPRAWTDAGIAEVAPASLGTDSGTGSGDLSLGRGGGSAMVGQEGSDRSSDLLEDEPPMAGAGWRTLARLGGDSEADQRRTTLGQPMVIHPHEVTNSEQGSLHSIRSHLNAHQHSHNAFGSGSQSPHTASASVGSSGSSRPSVHARSAGSDISLVHSGSISSDGRRRARRVTHSPSPPANFGRASLSAMGMGVAPPRLLTPSPTHHPYPSPPPTFASASMASMATHGDTVIDPSTGAIMHFPTAKWGGEDEEWPADAWTDIPGGNGARWWGPPTTMRSFQEWERVREREHEDAARHT